MMWLFVWPLFVVPFVLLFAFRHGTGAGYVHGGCAHPSVPMGQGDAVEIARTRLARGEITVEEFETIRRVLG